MNFITESKPRNEEIEDRWKKPQKLEPAKLSCHTTVYWM